MGNGIDLNMDSGWESICNDPARKASRRLEEKKQMNVFHQQKLLKCKKMINRALIVGSAAALSIVLGMTGTLTLWLACLAATVLTCAACFIAGGIWVEWKHG